MTPRSENNNQPSSSNQALINNRITSLNKDASKSILNSPRIQSQQEKKQQEPNYRFHRGKVKCIKSDVLLFIKCNIALVNQNSCN
jgi:hypothetical protein